MKYLFLFLGWLFALIFGLLTVSMLLLKNWFCALALVLLVVVCLPPVTSSIRTRWTLYGHPLLRFGMIILLLFMFIRLLMGGDVTSIYKTPEVKRRLMNIYDEKMKDWPVPFEDVFLNTGYGKVHVIVSGPENSPPMLLLHASAVSSWSWKYNIEGLSRHFRIYAIDLIGDAGKSEFADLKHIMKTGKDQAELYAEITKNLGVVKAYVVGASEGGFIGSNYAMFHPERVKKLVLLGPMGYSGALKSVLRITIAQLFPLKSIQESTFRWAFSDNAKLRDEYKEWFPLIMNGQLPAKVAPLPFSAEKRRRLSMPVLFVFGKKDNLVGNPEQAKARVQDIQNVRVEILDAGHLMAGELPDQVNTLIIDFCKNKTNSE